MQVISGLHSDASKEDAYLLIVSNSNNYYHINSLTFCGPLVQTVYAQSSINQPNLSTEAIVDGLSFSTSMAFMDNNNI